MGYLLYITWFKEETLKNDKSNTSNKHILKNYKSIEDYKPSGNLIYNSKSLEVLNKKKNSLFN